jgi:hypothetical protein
MLRAHSVRERRCTVSHDSVLNKRKGNKYFHTYSGGEIS